MARSRKQGKLNRSNIRKTKIEFLMARKKIELILKYGILAPSTHNTQPWKLRFIEDTIVELYADFSKKIPQADPTGRDLYMSLGAFLTNVELAAEELGVILKEKKQEKKSEEYVITLHFSNLDNAVTPEKSEILDSLISRQNYRGFFSQLQKEEITETGRILRGIGGKEVTMKLIEDANKINKLGELTALGLKNAYAKKEFRHEISTFINHNLSRKKHGLHGYSLRMNLPKSIIIPKVMKRKDIGAKLAVLNYKSFVTSSAVAVIVGPDDNKGWFESGKILEEALIKLTAMGFSSSIYAAAIEADDLRLQVKEIAEIAGKKQPQLLICIGKSDLAMPFSLRKDISKFVLSK